VRPDDLLYALNDVQPHIVHFSGHGSPAGHLVFHGGHGAVAPVSAPALKRVFAALHDNVALVFLNACFTTTQARALRTVVDVVVGMAAGIDDEAAIEFAASFYRALGFGRTVRNAFDQGVAALSMVAPQYERIPRLLCRRGIDPTKETMRTSPRINSKIDRVSTRAKQRSHVALDPLAGKEFLTGELHSFLEGHKPRPGAFSILLVDVDDLTLINKHFGAPVGDAVLQELPELLASEEAVLRVGRCGDDTFYVILAGAGIVESLQVGRRMMERIASHSWPAIAPGLRITCCAGAAELRSGEPMGDWVLRAGYGLLAAKHEGGDAVLDGPLRLPTPRPGEERSLWKIIS
jgi:diguanylate cyclase (GGDEF)-like protein